MVGTGRGAERGILIKGGEALEMAHRIDTVILDKTGTVTLGKPRVTAVLPVQGYTEDELLRLAASAERYSEHPLGKAVVEAAVARGLALAEAEDLRARRPRRAGARGARGRGGAAGNQLTVMAAPRAPSKSPTRSNPRPRRPCAACEPWASKSG